MKNSTVQIQLYSDYKLFRACSNCKSNKRNKKRKLFSKDIRKNLWEKVLFDPNNEKTKRTVGNVIKAWQNIHRNGNTEMCSQNCVQKNVFMGSCSWKHVHRRVFMETCQMIPHTHLYMLFFSVNTNHQPLDHKLLLI